ncbi:MAG: SDR family oxidoreductase [Chloroflexi bacterium]|nr:SDR family oxidoreductase [Chloroflexota bacterium]
MGVIPRFKGQAAIVTGAADGIGRGCAIKLAQEGANLLLTDINQKGLAETATLARKEGVKVSELVCDVSTNDAPQRLVEAAVKAFGSFQILVNNAGVSSAAPFLEYQEAALDKVIGVNLRAPLLIGKAASRYWIDNKIKGRIVNISSINAETIQGNSVAYCASKGGIRMLTMAAACDLGPHGITVNAVGPGHTKTGMTRNTIGTPVEQDWIERTPLGRIGEPADIANAVAFLASEEASYVTGQTIYVEGGRTIHIP